MKYIVLIFISLVIVLESKTQVIIDPKGTKVIVDSSKWIWAGNNIYNKNSGRIGIGTSSPLSKLHTTDDVRFEGIGTNTVNTKIMTTDDSGKVTTRLLSNLLSGNAITSLNGLSGSTQTFATGTSGTNFNIGSTGTVHTFNLPDASSSNRGALTSSDWSTFNGKENVLTFSTGLTRSTNTITVNTSQNINTLSNLTSNGLIKTSGGSGALSIATTGTDYSAGTSALATGILKSTTSSGTLSIAVAGDFPTLNQNTTGSAATLTNSRNIYGNAFNGSADITSIINSTYGGTGNGFTKFSGAATTEKTFTLPNANATILTDNTAVTVAQGGTGQTTFTDGQLLIGNSVGNTLTKSTLTAGTGISIINGNGSITIANTASGGTVTSVAELTLGTTGTDLSSSVANPTTTPIITLNVPTASASNRGVLSSTDWSTFNAKENALTFSTGLTRSTNTITVNTSQNISTLSNLTSNGLIKTSGGTGALSIATSGTDYSAGTSALATGILKSTTSTGALSIAVAGDFPTLNQNTTGSAATLTTARSIYGNSFNGSADLAQIIASTYGGTGNGFTKFSGPTTSEKTFTLPNASATILTDNATVTAAQGGTGNSSYTVGDILYASASTTLSKLAGVATGNALISGGTSTAPSWGKIGLTTHVSGILPIANGGTNSSTTLNNNRIMVSSGGAITEAAALTNGQLLIGSTGAAPVASTLTAGNGIVITNAAGSITIKNEPTIFTATSTTDATTTSTTDVLLTGMSVTPGAGDYLVFFTGNMENTNSDKQGTLSIYSNGTQIAASLVQEMNGGGKPINVATNAYITNLTAGQAIEVKWNVISNTGTFHQRTLIVQKVK